MNHINSKGIRNIKNTGIQTTKLRIHHVGGESGSVQLNVVEEHQSGASGL